MWAEAQLVYLSFMHTWAVIFVLLAFSLAMGQSKTYPKPQVSAAVRELAPNFTLKAQDAKTFRLADQRGQWVLLFFYRGYW